MNDRNLVIKTLKHQACETIPYQLDLTSDMETKINSELGSDFLSGVDNCFALERNEEFSMIDSHRKKDMFGAVWLLDQMGDFGVVENCLLPEPTLKNYVFPKPDEEKIREKCSRLVSKRNKQKFSMYTIGFSLYERAWSLRGVENLLMDMILNPSFVHELFENIVEYNLGVAKIAMEYPIDGIFFGDDWGQQKGLIMGPGYWKTFIKPSLGTLYAAIKGKGKYLCQHSCGDIHEVFGDLIDLGLDMYNTFQPEIYDVPKIKSEFGKDLTFYGGISTQQVLPFGTAAEVKQTTRKMMEIMGTRGGYVVAPTHSMPNDIPIDNVLAFLDVVQNQ
jgi:uroporphyrinogen decarboxylase